MAANNNTTIVFSHPFPDKRDPVTGVNPRGRMRAIIEENGFALDWDARVVDLDTIKPGPVVLRARNVSYSVCEEVIGLAHQHDFSVILHRECFQDYESEYPNYVWAYDAASKHEIDAPAGANTWEPLIPFNEVLKHSHEFLARRYSLPPELADADPAP